jgi:hypothetical protein
METLDRNGRMFGRDHYGTGLPTGTIKYPLMPSRLCAKSKKVVVAGPPESRLAIALRLLHMMLIGAPEVGAD